MSVTPRYTTGLRLAGHKRRALEQPIAPVGPAAVAVVPLDQGDGIPARVCVSAGDRVRVGEPIALDETGEGADVHAPVAGRVREIAVRPTAGAAGHGPCVVIDNDASDEPDPRNEPCPQFEALAPDALVERIRRAGIVGLGGAAFPTAAKLARGSARSIGHLVLNGAECEPWICCDDALMRERAADVVLGAQALLHATGAGRSSIAIEDDKPEAVEAMNAAVAAASDPRIVVEVLPATYPTGAERTLLTALTGVEVPTDGWPAEVGLGCQNVGTAAAIAAMLRTGEPLIRRIVTVSGSGVGIPRNLEARIGTPIAALVEAAGDYTGRPERLICGGNMTGRAIADDALPLTKAMNCILVATGEDLRAAGPELPCIRCGDCARVCPARLLPQQLYRAARAADHAALERYGLVDCIECGGCDYVCPSSIPLTERFRVAKRERTERVAAAARAAQARLDFERHERRIADAEAARHGEFEDARRRARGEGPGVD